MNFSPTTADFDVAQALQIEPDLEQIILAACIQEPRYIAELAARATPDDFEFEAHRLIVANLFALHEEGRSPSVHGLRELFGDEEIEPGLTAFKYCGSLITMNYPRGANAFADAIETLIDRKSRSKLSEIGGHLQSAVLGQQSVGDLTADAIQMLDDVAASTRKGKTQRYEASEAVAAALGHLRGPKDRNPTTGLDDLDKMIGGWPKGQLSIIAGRPGMGKSMVAVSSARRAAKKGHCVAFFSLEMTQKQIGSRLIADMAFINSDPVTYQDILDQKIHDRRRRERLAEEAQKQKHLPITIEEKRGLTVSEITAKAKKLAAQLEKDGQTLDIIFVDHIGLVRPSNRYAGIRHREIAETTDALAALAKDLDCAVIGISQLNRGVESRDNKRPSLADLKDSGSIEEDASLIIFAYREYYYLQLEGVQDDPDAERCRQEALERTENKIELINAKNRNGRTGKVDAFAHMGANALRNASFDGGRR